MSPQPNDPDDVRDLLAGTDPDGSAACEQQTRDADQLGAPANGRTEVTLANGNRLTCVVCGHDSFVHREVLMNTAGLTFLDLDWANRAGDGAICRACGFVHTFLGVAVSWRVPDGRG